MEGCAAVGVGGGGVEGLREVEVLGVEEAEALLPVEVGSTPVVNAVVGVVCSTQ